MGGRVEAIAAGDRHVDVEVPSGRIDLGDGAEHPRCRQRSTVAIYSVGIVGESDGVTDGELATHNRDGRLVEGAVDDEKRAGEPFQSLLFTTVECGEGHVVSGTALPVPLGHLRELSMAGLVVERGDDLDVGGVVGRQPFQRREEHAIDASADVLLHTRPGGIGAFAVSALSAAPQERMRTRLGGREEPLDERFENLDVWQVRDEDADRNLRRPGSRFVEK